MKTSSTESFHSTRSRSSSISDFPPPPESTSHMNTKLGVPPSTTLTTYNVGQLNNLCQIVGLSPRFEIDGEQSIGFGGYLNLGPHSITRTERWPSKKAAREGLAEKGLVVVRDLQKKKAKEETSVGNWTGMLLTFHQLRGQTGNSGGPVFTEYTIGTLFACTCLISLHPTPFGSESVGFTTKKAARTSAAREAMEFLISFGYATPYGKPRPIFKTEKPSTPVANKKSRTEGKSSGSFDAIAPVLNNTDAPYAQRVNELCPVLGLKIPQYRLQASGSSLYSGSAYFVDEPLLRGPIGEIENIFGKKNAKEESARGVWKVLIALAEQRGVSGRAIDEEQDLL